MYELKTHYNEAIRLQQRYIAFKKNIPEVVDIHKMKYITNVIGSAEYNFLIMMDVRDALIENNKFEYDLLTVEIIRTNIQLEFDLILAEMLFL